MLDVYAVNFWRGLQGEQDSVWEWIYGPVAGINSYLKGTGSWFVVERLFMGKEKYVFDDAFPARSF